MASGIVVDMDEKRGREDGSVYRLSEDEREALDLSAADVREVRLATDEKMAAIFK